MRKNLYTSLLIWICLLPFYSNGQSFPSIDTLYSFANSNSDCFVTVSGKTGGRNVLLGGYVQGPTDLDPGPGVINAATLNPANLFPYLTKQSSDGSIIWSRWWPGINGVAFANSLQDSLGNIYLVGQFIGSSFDADPISTFFVNGIPSTSARDFSSGVIIKLDSNGLFLWGESIPGAFPFNVTLSGNQSRLVVSGLFNSGIDTNLLDANLNLLSSHDSITTDLFVYQFSASTGQFLNKAFFQGTAEVYDYSLNANGNDEIILAGLINNGNLDVNPDPNVTQLLTTFAARSRALVCVLDSNLNYKRHAIWQGPAKSGAINTYPQANGDMWVTGRYEGDQFTFDMDPSGASLPATIYNNINSGYWYVLLDSNFSVVKGFNHNLKIAPSLFQRYYGNPQMLFKNGNTYVGATFHDSLSLNVHQSSFTPVKIRNPGIAINWSSYIAKIDSADSLVYVYYPEPAIGGQTAEFMNNFFFVEDKIVLTGSFEPTVDFDPSPSVASLTAPTTWSNFMVRLNDCAQPDSVPQVNQKYAYCDSIQLADTTFTENGWHQVQRLYKNKAGCDSVLSNDSIFVFSDRPTVINQTTYLEAQVNDTLYGEWIDCNTDSVMQVGGQRFYPQRPGNYALVYTHPNAPNCGDTLSCEAISQISLDEALHNQWSVYPNPFKSNITIKGDLKELEWIELYTLSGQLIKSVSARPQMDMEQFPAGAYLIKLRGRKFQQQLKLIKY